MLVQIHAGSAHQFLIRVVESIIENHILLSQKFNQNRQKIFFFRFYISSVVKEHRGFIFKFILGVGRGKIRTVFDLHLHIFSILNKTNHNVILKRSFPSEQHGNPSLDFNNIFINSRWRNPFDFRSKLFSIYSYLCRIY